jgi:hypothetical protein
VKRRENAPAHEEGRGSLRTPVRVATCSVGAVGRNSWIPAPVVSGPRLWSWRATRTNRRRPPGVLAGRGWRTVIPVGRLDRLGHAHDLPQSRPVEQPAHVLRRLMGDAHVRRLVGLPHAALRMRQHSGEECPLSDEVNRYQPMERSSQSPRALCPVAARSKLPLKLQKGTVARRWTLIRQSAQRRIVAPPEAHAACA